MGFAGWVLRDLSLGFGVWLFTDLNVQGFGVEALRLGLGVLGYEA